MRQEARLTTDAPGFRRCRFRMADTRMAPVLPASSFPSATWPHQRCQCQNWVTLCHTVFFSPGQVVVPVELSPRTSSDLVASRSCDTSNTKSFYGNVLYPISQKCLQYTLGVISPPSTKMVYFINAPRDRQSCSSKPSPFHNKCLTIHRSGDIGSSPACTVHSSPLISRHPVVSFSRQTNSLAGSWC